MRLFYLYDGNPYTGKKASLYRDEHQVTIYYYHFQSNRKNIFFKE